MQRTIRQAIIFLALLLVISLVRIPYGSYKERILPALRKATANGPLLSIDADDFVVSFPTRLTVEKLSASFRAGPLPLPLYVESMDFSLRLLPLLWLTTALEGDASLYKGKVDVQASRSVFGGKLSFAAVGSGVNLAEYPAFRPFGGAGTLEFNVSGSAAQDPATLAQLDEAKAVVQLHNASLAGTGNWIPLVKLPPISEIEGRIDAQLKASQWTLQTLQLASSLGTVKGNGSGKLAADGNISQGNIKLRIALNEAGKSVIGGYLALASGASVDNPPLNYQVDVQLRLGSKPIAKITAS